MGAANAGHVDVLRGVLIAGVVERNGGPREAVLGYPVLGTDEDFTQLREKYEFALVTVGQIKSSTPKGLYAQPSPSIPTARCRIS